MEITKCREPCALASCKEHDKLMERLDIYIRMQNLMYVVVILKTIESLIK